MSVSLVFDAVHKLVKVILVARDGRVQQDFADLQYGGAKEWHPDRTWPHGEGQLTSGTKENS